jgi:phage gp29-like protein
MAEHHGLRQRIAGNKLFGWTISAVTPTGRKEPAANPGVKVGRPKRVQLVHPHVEQHADWSVTQVRQALDSHELGDFFDSAKLWEAMGRDDRIYGTVRSRINALLSKGGAQFSITESDNGEDKFIPGVEEWWWSAMPEHTQRALLSDMIGMGVALARIKYKTTARQWTPESVTHWPLHSVQWDQTERKFRTTTEQHGELLIDPQDPEWLVITPDGERSWMGGAVRALGLAYVMRQFNWRDWARFNERHGMPLIAIDEPPEQDPDVRESFWRGIKKMGSTGVVRLPQGEEKDDGYDVRFVEAKSRGHETFTDFRVDLDVAIAVVILGQNLTTEVQGGSFAATKAHGKVRQDIIDGDGVVLATSSKQQIIVPWGALNFAGFTEADAPNPAWDTGFPEDKKETAEVYLRFAEACTIFLEKNLPVDITEMARRLGVPLEEAAEIKIEPLPPDDPNAEPDDDDDDDGDQFANGRRFLITAKDGTKFRCVMRNGELVAQEAGHFHIVEIDGDEIETTISNTEGLHRHTVEIDDEDIETSADETGAGHTHSLEVDGETFQTEGPISEDEATEAKKDKKFYEARGEHIEEDASSVWREPPVQARSRRRPPPRRIKKPTVASGLTAQSEGFIDSQLYADELSDHGARLQAKEFGGADGFVTKLLEAIDAGASYPEIRKAVMDTYKDEAPPEEISKVIESLWMMANRAGETGVDQDT